MKKSTLLLIAAVSLLVLLLSAACKGAQGEQGSQGDRGVTGAAGPQGVAGQKGDPGEPGPLPLGVVREPVVTLNVSNPANGTHFVTGEGPVVTITLSDQYERPLSREDFARFWLVVYGPQDPNETVTAVKLLNTSADRSASPHHYVDVLANEAITVSGNVLTYALQKVTDEAPGTYVAASWAILKASGLQQTFPLTEFQIGTATVETQVVEETKCATCHLGAASGKFYLHHIDPSFSPEGNWAIDSEPVRTCKTCHNNDGYAAYNGLPGAPATTDPNVSRVPDPIVRRVHGVHMGEGLSHLFNISSDTGDFRDYIHVEFPKDVRNCTACHVDDQWKAEPSRLACGACHDNIWFGTEAEIPLEMKEHNMELHPGGPQASDANCALCHTSADSGDLAIPVVHKVDLSTPYTVEITMSAPANGKFYAAGEMPKLTIAITDAATGAVVDPATIKEADWNRVSLQVSGPREHTEPVLTAAAANRALSGSTSYVYNDLRVRTDPAKENPGITRSATAITYQLDDVEGLEPGTYTVFSQARKVSGSSGVALVNFQVGTETVEPQIATNCTACHGDQKMHGSYPFAFAPDICKNCHDYERQLEGKTKWSENNWGYGAAPISRRVHGVHFGHYLDKPLEVYGNPANFDASKIIFPQDVRNCVKCHSESDMWKEEASRLACLACHDSDEAIGHASLQTINPTPGLADYGDEVETCAVCHGAGREFAPDVVHNIWDPYAPPYPREAD